MGSEIAKRLYEALNEAGVKFDRPDAHDASEIVLGSSNPILSQDLEGKLNFANNAAADFFRYPPERFIGMPSENLVPENQRKGRQAIISKVVQTGEHEYFGNTLRKRGDGSLVAVPRWVGFRYKLGDRYSFAALLYVT